MVVTPTTLVKNWAGEISKWLGSYRLEPIVVAGSGKETDQLVKSFQDSRLKRLLIISYELYRKYQKVLNAIAEVDLMICDEGHRLKSAKGNQTIAALKGVQTERRVILTGTPLQNNLSEFFAMIDFVCPYALGMDYSTFRRIFQTPIEESEDTLATLEQKEVGKARSVRLQRLTTPFILRRLATVNKAFLPPKTVVTLFVQLTASQQSLYQQLVSSVYHKRVFKPDPEVQCPEAMLKEDEVTRLIEKVQAHGTAHALQLICILRKLCIHPILLRMY